MIVSKVNKKSATRMQPRFGKTDSRYWKQRVRKAKGKNFYGVQIQSCGERHFLSLGTANQDEAASRAAKLFLDVKAKGWRKVMEEQRPEPEKKFATITPSRLSRLS